MGLGKTSPQGHGGGEYGDTNRGLAQMWTGGVVRMCVWACLWGVVGVFGVATVRRNRDWVDEKALFRAALHVCPGSAKVHVNWGILLRRDRNYSQVPPPSVSFFFLSGKAKVPADWGILWHCNRHRSQIPPPSFSVSLSRQSQSAYEVVNTPVL